MRQRFLYLISLVFAPAAVVFGQTATAPVPIDRVRAHMSRMLTTLPNYTCLQTVERSERNSDRKKWAPLDVIRIEVALVNGKELFSWPGEGNFTDRSISEMVGGGSIGTGSFAMHAKAVFQDRGADFTFVGESQWKDRRTLVWTFQVPQRRSAFAIRRGTEEAVVGYGGSIRIDAQTLDALQLEVTATEIPEKMDTRSTSEVMEYKRVPISGSTFLLPLQSELVMVSTDGYQSHNLTRFSGCRQFSGESKLLFDDPPPDAAPVTGTPRVLQAPPGLTVDFTLDKTTRLRDAAIGDPLVGTLQRSIKLPDHSVIAKGAKVHGRIVQIRKVNYLRTSAVATAALFYEVEGGNTRLTMDTFLRSVYTAGPEVLWRDMSMGLQGPDPKAPGGYVFVRDTTPVLREGLRMVWQTMNYNREAAEKEKAGHSARP